MVRIVTSNVTMSLSESRLLSADIVGGLDIACCSIYQNNNATAIGHSPHHHALEGDKR